MALCALTTALPTFREGKDRCGNLAIKRGLWEGVLSTLTASFTLSSYEKENKQTNFHNLLAMEIKNMVYGLLLIAAFALPALATRFEKDFVTDETVQAILKKVSPNSNGMLDEQTNFQKDFISYETIQAILKNVGANSNVMLDEETISALTGKTLISNPVLEEALLQHSNSINALGGGRYCKESCIHTSCLSVRFGCKCSQGNCFKNSLA